MSYIECNFIDRESEEEVRENTVKQGFSLMEMMVVLLIMAIIAAATAPIVSKKMMASKSITSPWVFTGEGKNIAYNMGGLSNAVAIIGAAKVPAGTKTRLYIDCGDDTAQIALGKGDTAASILADPVGKRVGIFSATSSVSVPNGSVVLGMGQSIGGSNVVAIGNSATSNNSSTVAIGDNSKASSAYAVSIGTYTTATDSSAVAIGNSADATGFCSTALGYNAVASANYATALGSSTQAKSSYSVAIGGDDGSTSNGANASGENAIAIGRGSLTSNNKNAIAIGYSAKVDGRDGCAVGAYSSVEGAEATAIGMDAEAKSVYSTAIGYRASVPTSALYSTAIGYGATATKSRQIVLGTEEDTVFIPGNLIVQYQTYLGTKGPHGIGRKKAGVHMAVYEEGGVHKTGFIREYYGDDNGLYHSADNYNPDNLYSDKRLKNIGEKFTAGVNELKKLDLYHYTFKKDESKTPHVGVIAQDLQKVFPDAVTKDDDGYLRIRFEDMFFAMINAIKELDEKISNIISKNDEQDKIIEAQQKTIEELQKQNEEFSSRLKKLEEQKV